MPEPALPPINSACRRHSPPSAQPHACGFAVFFLAFLLSCASDLRAGEQRITSDGALKLSPVFLSKGTEVIYSVHDEPTKVSLIRLNLADGKLSRVDSANPAHQFDADMTADGKLLCYVLTYTSPQSILVIKDVAAGTETRYIPKEARATVRNPKFAPDLKRIIFTLSDVGGQDIAAVDLKGENLKRLTNSVGTNAWAAPSPDGRQIAFSSSRDGSFHLYIMQADGSEVRQLTDHPLRDMRPAWSPDGKRIAFVSARDGNLEIYVIDADGSNLRRITDNVDRDDFPIWHPNGRQVLTVSERDGNSDLYLIDVDE